jgi:predicted MFS family arabinose efflux permease
MALPLQIGVAIDSLGLSERRSGILGTAEIGTLSIVAMMLAAKIADWSKVRVTMAGLALVISGQAASAFMDSFATFLVARIVVGAGAGLMYGAACASIAGISSGERLYAWGTSLSQLLTTGMLATLPLVVELAQQRGLFLAYAVLGAVFGLLLLRLPDGDAEIPAATVHGEAAYSPAFFFLLFSGISLFNLAIGMVWAFTERRAEELGFGAAEIGGLLSMLSLGAIGGSMLAGIVGSRFGRLAPLMLGMGACMFACSMIALGLSKYLLFVAIFSLGAFELFCFPFLIATAAALDETGRLATLAGGVSIFTYALGPAIGGYIAAGFSVAAVSAAGALLCLLAAMALLPVGRFLDRGREFAI